MLIFEQMLILSTLQLFAQSMNAVFTVHSVRINHIQQVIKQNKSGVVSLLAPL